MNSSTPVYSNENFEKCKKVMTSRQLIPFFSIPQTIIGSLNIIPWVIILLIVTFMLII